MDTKNLEGNPAKNPNAGVNGTQIVDVEVEGHKMKVEVDPTDDKGQAPYRIVDGLPDTVGDEFHVKVSRELQNQYKKNLETAQKLKQQQANLENAKNDNPDLRAEIEHLKGMIEGLTQGMNANDNRVNENRNQPSNTDKPEDLLLRAAGVETWEEFEELSPAETAKAQVKFQQLQFQELKKMNDATKQQYEEKMLLTSVKAFGYTPDEMKSWAAANGVPVTENTVGLFLQLKKANNNNAPDDIELYNQRTRIKETIVSPDLSDSIPNYQFTPSEEKQRKQKVNSLKEALKKTSATGNLNPAMILGHK